MSLPVKVIIDWGKLEICEECASRIAKEITKIIKNRKQASIDISVLLCDECWRHNVDNCAIRVELDPSVVRRR